MSAEAQPGETIQRGQAWEKLWSLVRDIHTCMMTTQDGEVLRSRPMAGHASANEGELWFFTKASSHKTDEIEDQHQVNLAFANPDKQEFVSISGRAGLVRDRQKIDELWNGYVSAWFPNGKDDPDVALIRVDVEEAEYWDGPASRMVQLWRLAAAKARSREPDMGENVKL